MARPHSQDALAALRDFVTRIDALDPHATALGELTVRLDGEEVRLTLRAPVAEALVEALRVYHDPRDRGRCDHCGGGRLDDNFRCLDCGRFSGVFGQLLAERAAGYTEPEQLPGPDRQD
ncbi:hypothetical protein Cs7R123_62350 [Catellatospora sp. TT07R-123]|uniref:hypothetical protein n=1 Tax=Catellatospora sp. TT07R-123 TaxID=2733863 RepID=UPI001B15682B|nr:hypothetical protein [Catellatospora sp. TT07R-123]GHJ48893.1 hypothetical protein Cs7R123_62350 [Catellatospora sp. TT07R-123]